MTMLDVAINVESHNVRISITPRTIALDLPTSTVDAAQIPFRTTKKRIPVRNLTRPKRKR